jgi:hypothetical protein
LDDDFVSLKQLAVEFSMDRSHMRKYVLKSGIQPHRRRTPDSGSQQTLALTPVEAESIRSKRREEGFLGSHKLAAKEFGVFYLIQLVPELDPRRIKLGFADDIATRMGQHKTAAPTAALVKCWPCKRSWESTVIDCLSVECKLILSEVYECDDVTGLVDKADRLFALLPDPDQRAELSAYSPHNT